MDILGTLSGLVAESGFAGFFANGGWKSLIMIAVACVLLYLGIGKKFEPLLMVGIAFGVLLTNIPGGGLYHMAMWDAYIYEAPYDAANDMVLYNVEENRVMTNEEYVAALLASVDDVDVESMAQAYLSANASIFGEIDMSQVPEAEKSAMAAFQLIEEGDLSEPDIIEELSFTDIIHHGGLLDILYIGVKAGIYPCLIFIGIGAMTDFGPLIARPSSLMLGAAAQLGVFLAFFGAVAMGFTGPEAGSIGIIGGADGPTAILTTTGASVVLSSAWPSS